MKGRSCGEKPGKVHAILKKDFYSINGNKKRRFRANQKGQTTMNPTEMGRGFAMQEK